jgi:hypothetical protein
MFDSLADQMHQDEVREGVTTKSKVVRLLTVVALSVLLFGGLYMGVRMLEG